MPSRYRSRDEANYAADATLQKLAVESRTARLMAGLSLRALAAMTGISRSQLSRIERGRCDDASLRALSIIFAVLGMRLSARPYPMGPPSRDAAHARLLTRFRVLLPPATIFRTEVPFDVSGDLRAWDAGIWAGGRSCMVEAETALYDLQAIDRRIALKMSDDEVAVVILLVADTRRNRRVLGEFRDLNSLRYPLDARAIIPTLRARQVPGLSGVVTL